MAMATMRMFPTRQGLLCSALSSRRPQMAPGPGLYGVPVTRPGWPATELPARSRRRYIWRSRLRNRRGFLLSGEAADGVAAPGGNQVPITSCQPEQVQRAQGATYPRK